MGGFRRVLSRYGGALASVALALQVRSYLPGLADKAPYATFFVAIAVSVWFGGLGPGVIAFIAGGLAAATYILPPYSSIQIAESADRWSMLMYAIVGITLIAFGEAHRRQKARAERNAQLAESGRSEAARQHETLRVTMVSIGDGVIATDALGRVSMMNAVAQNLTGWPEAEAAGRPLHEIFRIVNEQTREEIENPAVRAISETRVITLANHTVLLSKSGGEIPIDDSAAPIRGSGGEISGAILIFRDITARRRAQRALQESEALFRSMADNAPVLIWISSAEGQCEYVNRQWLDFTGRTLEQELGGGWSASLHPEDLKTTAVSFGEAAGARRAFHLEFRLRRHDGEYHWMISSGMPRFDPDGSFAGFIGSCMDIHERKRFETELLRMSWVVANTDDAVLSKAMDGTILTWNKGAERIYGYSAGEAIGRSIFFVVPEHRAAETQSIMDRVRRGESVQSYETERRRSDGVSINVSLTISPIRNSSGEIIGMSTISREITARLRAEKALREGEQNLRLALSAARMGTWTNDIIESRVHWSPELEQIFGLEPGTFSGTEEDFFGLIHPEDRDRVAAEIRLAIEHRTDYDTEFRYRRADGSVGWMSGRGRPYYNADGSLIRLAGIGMDITERKGLELDLKQRTEDLTRSNRELEQFAYISSHDLQEPLRTVGAYAQLLARRYHRKLDKDADDFIGFIVNGVKRMQNQIEALLAYSRAGAPTRGVGPVDSDSALEDALANLKNAIDASGAVVTRDALPTVHANEMELGQIFQNLVANAIKFRGDSQPRIHISAERADGVWQFSVRDNGIGIDPNYNLQIFEIFKRLHSGDQDGTGIGLAICKKIVESYGGSIWVESKPGEGATFFFTLRPAASSVTA